MANIGTAGKAIPTDQIRHPNDAIMILCELQAEVAQNVHKYTHTADCFCGGRASWVDEGRWQNEGLAIQFIIDATRAAMEEALEQDALQRFAEEWE